MLVLVQVQRQLIVDRLVLVPLLALMPFVLELIIIQLKHRLVDQPQRFGQHYQQQVFQQQLIQLQQVLQQSFPLQFGQQLSHQVRRLRELRHQVQHQPIDIQLQLKIMKFMPNLKLEIIA